MKSLFVKCPHCKKEFDYSDEKINKFRPFCSERCKMVDLGHWFDESYRVEKSATSNQNDEDLESSDSESEGINEKNEYES